MTLCEPQPLTCGHESAGLPAALVHKRQFLFPPPPCSATVTPMKNHVGWIVPLAGMAVVWFFGPLVLNAVAASALGVIPKGLIVLALFAGCIFLGIYLLIKVIQNGHRTFRAHRRSGGHLNKAERAQADLQRTYDEAWSAARVLTAGLRRGQAPPAQEVWGVVLEPGESVHLFINADYARFYGLNGTYVHTSGFFWGRPSFVLAGVGLAALANRSRRRAAQAVSLQQWREKQHTQMFLTDRKIIAQVNGRWLSFPYSQISACYPEPENCSLVLEFYSYEPLLIGGPEAPLAIAYLVWALYGEHGLAAHPALQSLRS